MDAVDQRHIFVKPLSTILGEYNSSALEKMLLAFSCAKDEDVQRFLQKEAVKHEVTGKARTYIYFNYKGEIIGYFALAIKSIAVTEKLLEKYRHELGLDVPNCKYIKPYIPAYLLALVGKDDGKFSKDIYGQSFLDMVMPEVRRHIKTAREHVGGQVLYLDCAKVLIDYYGKKGFEYFQENPDDAPKCKEEDKLFQMWQLLS